MEIYELPWHYSVLPVSFGPLNVGNSIAISIESNGYRVQGRPSIYLLLQLYLYFCLSCRRLHTRIVYRETGYMAAVINFMQPRCPFITHFGWKFSGAEKICCMNVMTIKDSGICIYMCLLFCHICEISWCCTVDYSVRTSSFGFYLLWESPWKVWDDNFKFRR